MAEIRPDLITDGLRQAFSQRANEIAEFVRSSRGHVRGMVRPRAAPVAWRKTRGPKAPAMDLGAGASVSVRIVSARAAELNFTHATYGPTREACVHNRERFDLAPLADRPIFGPTGVTGLNNTFERKDVVIEVRAVPRTAKGSWASPRSTRASSTSWQRPPGDLCRHPRPAHDYTTQELRDTEQASRRGTRGQAAGRAQLNQRRSRRASQTSHQSINHESCSQRTAGRGAWRLSDGNAISSIEALAGSGKTTTAAAMRMGFEAAGYRTIGMGQPVAPSGSSEPSAGSSRRTRSHGGR